MTFDEFCAQRGVTIRTRQRVLARDDDKWEHYSMKCTLTYQGRKLTTVFRQGLAHEKEPTAAEVLACLLSDATSVGLLPSSGYSFEEWCGELGYDSDSRKAERIYEACRLSCLTLWNLLGEDLEAFVTASEDY